MLCAPFERTHLPLSRPSSAPTSPCPDLSAHAEPKSQGHCRMWHHKAESLTTLICAMGRKVKPESEHLQSGHMFSTRLACTFRWFLFPPPQPPPPPRPLLTSPSPLLTQRSQWGVQSSWSVLPPATQPPPSRGCGCTPHCHPPAHSPPPPVSCPAEHFHLVQ